MVLKISPLLLISLVSATLGLAFLTGLFSSVVPDAAIHSHADIQQAEAAKLPLQVIERFSDKKMAGDARSGSSLKVDEDFVDPENHCEFCTRVEYVPGSQGLAGFAYSSDDGVDLSGAKKVKFWVMGEEGGEKVKFKIAGKERQPGDRSARDSLSIFSSELFARTSNEVSLKHDWTKYEVSLDGVDLKSVNLPFGLEVAKGAGDKSQVIYLKGVVIDDAPVEAKSALATLAAQVTNESDFSVELTQRPTTGDTSTSFRFSADVSGGEAPYSYAWDFGDGQDETSDTVRHAFDDPGTYNVTLVVTDDSGQVATSSLEVQVSAENEEAENQDSNSTDAAQQEEEGGEEQQQEVDNQAEAGGQQDSPVSSNNTNNTDSERSGPVGNSSDSGD
ncbi:MAG TPA: PKD domain-containing protein [Nitrososphaera sp.]|nr:PKD domain-containing protein [Nitrososphaera sp.]